MSDEAPKTFSPTLHLLKVLEILQHFLIITRGTASPSGWSRGGGSGHQGLSNLSPELEGRGVCDLGTAGGRGKAGS